MMRVPGAQFSSSYQDVYAFIRALIQMCAFANRELDVTESLTVNPQEIVLGTNEAAEVHSIPHTVIVTLLLDVLPTITA
jgi:hypothetical protein